MARSSTEAEYRSLAQTTCELIWLQNLMCDLGIFLKNPPLLWYDNIGATYLASNPVFHQKMKHIDLDYHFVHEHVVNKSLRIAFISTKDRTTDALIKPLPTAQFQALQTKLSLVELRSRGDTKTNTLTMDPST